METTATDLVGKLLLAMPSMSDPRFERSVIYICAHSREGAMGLIVNKPAEKLNFKDLIEQLEIPSGDGSQDVQVHFGGPVENGRGFVLHTTDYMANESTLEVDGAFSMTATLDILEDIANGQGPKTSLLALGYSGWAAGQLDAEILQNGWLICDATADLLFHLDNDAKWTAALDSMGISPLLLSADAGRA